MANEAGFWLSIVEYSQLKKVSISTLRRRIKSKTIKFKEVEGKYFIYSSSEQPLTSSQTQEYDWKAEIEKLKNENRNLKEQLIDYENLVALYENSELHE
jgi:hypothetical protein